MHAFKHSFVQDTLSGLAIPASITTAKLDISLPDEGVLLISPRTAVSSYVLLSAGIHGNETAPIEILDRIVDDLLAGTLPLSCKLMIMLGNPAAMRTGSRFIGYDMNRLFNGAHRQHPTLSESTRAQALEKLAATFFAEAPAGMPRIHHDLHTAIRGSVFEQFAIYPFLHERKHDSGQLNWLADAGISTVLLHSKPAATFSYYTSQHCHAHAFTLELGKARPFGQNDLSRFEPINQALRQLLANGEARSETTGCARLQLFRAKYDLIRTSEHFELHLADDVENFTLLSDGMTLAVDGDVIVRAHGGNERILFPNRKVGIGLRAGIVIEPCQLQA